MKKILFCLIALFLVTLQVVNAEEGGRGRPRSQCVTGESDFGRFYKTCTPSSYDGTPLPLIVVLHGCSQSADAIEFETEMTLFAEQRNFIVLYPEQLATENTSSCWNWFMPEHQARDAGEPADIMSMVDAVKGTYSVDEQRTYITGISAGGAMSVIMGALYPDVFVAVGVAAGLEFKAAENVLEGLTAQVLGGPDPDQQGTLVYQTMGAAAQRVPVIVFHGSLDNTVNPVNGEQVAQQWTQTNDWIDDGQDNDSIDYVADEVIDGQVPDGGRSYTHTIYHDSAGVPIVEHYLVQGMTHRWSGGAEGGTYTDPTGPKSSELMIDFFYANAREVPTAVGVSEMAAGRAIGVNTLIILLIGLMMLSVNLQTYERRG